MGNVENSQKVIGISRATTWGTAVAVTDAYDGNLTTPITRSQSIGVDVNSKFNRYIRTTDESVNVNLTGMATYDGAWLHGAYGIYRFETPGTGTAPVEQTGGQGDYLHTWDQVGFPAAPFYTLNWHVGSTVAAYIPSVQFQSLSMDFPVNNAATFSLAGVGNRLLRETSTGATNGTANLDTIGAVFPPYELVCFGDSSVNHYFRLGPTSGSLTSTQNMPVRRVAFSMTRGEQTYRATAGANSYYIQQPREVSRFSGTLTVDFALEEFSGYEPLAAYLAQFLETDHLYHAELFIDGSAIGTGDNRSLKFQFPFLNIAGEKPTGYDRDGDGPVTVSVTYQIMQVPAGLSTPPGQNSNTPSFEILNERSTGYSA